MDTSIYLAIPGFGFSGGLQIRGFKTSSEMQNMLARPIVSVDWAGPLFRTVDAKGFTAWRFLEEIFRHGLEDAFVLCLRDLPSRLLPNHRGLSSVPAAVHYLRSLCREMRSILCVSLKFRFK
jgi:hypothetical protein